MLAVLESIVIAGEYWQCWRVLASEGLSSLGGHSHRIMIVLDRHVQDIFIGSVGGCRHLTIRFTILFSDIQQ